MGKHSTHIFSNRNIRNEIPGRSSFAGIATALPVGDSEPEAGREKYGPAPVYKPAPIQSELPPRKRQAGYGPPPPVYKPAPVPIAHPEAKLPPQPYQFEYGVADQYTGTNFQAVENQDEKGTVIGSYRVNLPDGRVQT